MAEGFVLGHFNFDGPLFDDPVLSIFGLVVINLGVFALLMFALFAVKEGRKMANREAKARRKALKQGRSEQLVSMAESDSTNLQKTLTTSPSPARTNRKTARPLATAGSAQSRNYSRPPKTR